MGATVYTGNSSREGPVMSFEIYPAKVVGHNRFSKKYALKINRNNSEKVVSQKRKDFISIMEREEWRALGI